MIRCYEVDVMDGMDLDHLFNPSKKGIRIDEFPKAVPRNLIILAKRTLQGTSRKKNGP